MLAFADAARQLDELWVSAARHFDTGQNFRSSLILPDQTTSTNPRSRLQKSIPNLSYGTRKATLAVLGPLLLIALIVSSLLVTRGSQGYLLQRDASSQQGLNTQGPDHPIKQLVQTADDQLRYLQASQSSTLQEAVTEYQRRYKLPPPPYFDHWYEYATLHGTELIDEFDTILDSLILFWGISPATVRERTRQALDGGNNLLTCKIRGGNVRVIGEGQNGYQGPATEEMISKFSKWLPDMDLAFNIHDEARVLVPHEGTARLMMAATASMSAVKPANTLYSHPNNSENEDFSGSTQRLQFNRLDHQQTFSHSCMSCPPDSASRNLELIDDQWTGYTYDGITFVDNVTSYSDLCLRPSARSLVGMFNHPNVYSVSHDLVPVFTPSKPSTFHDILYPSYYYYKDRTTFDEGYAVLWEEKNPHLYWRGATSGGYSEGGIWRDLLRQSVLMKLTSDGTTRILTRDGEGPKDKQWRAQEVDRSTIRERYDAEFTEVKQCASQDCSEMYAQFGSHAHAAQEEAWKNRYLLDLDGNAYSGRFYSLLKSFSLPFKVAFYREWHMNRILPWVHYVPFSSTTDEYAETLRYFEDEAEGQDVAKGLALNGRDWANKTIRTSDMEVYMFRLLLEYGRIVDDNRLNLGYKG